MPARFGVRAGRAVASGLVLLPTRTPPSRARAGVRGFRIVRVGGLIGGGVGVDRRGGARAVAGRWPGALSWLRRVAVAVGSRARAPGPDGSWRAEAATAARAVRSVRAQPRATARLVGAAPARRGGGHRSCAAVEGHRRGWASHDRQQSGTLAGHGAWLAARRGAPRGCIGGLRDAVDDRAGRGETDDGRMPDWRRAIARAACSPAGVLTRGRARPARRAVVAALGT